MANYTTGTSDKKKKTALIFWLIGIVGLLGLEYFYVGKIKKGFIRLIVGILFAMAIYAILTTTQSGPVWIIFWAIISLPNLARISIGIFKDNVGHPLRA